MASGFGAVLRRLRDRAGLTQEELERRSGVSVSTIRGLETGKRSNPRMSTVEQLAGGLALRPEEREELLVAAGLLDPLRPGPSAPGPALPDPSRSGPPPSHPSASGTASSDPPASGPEPSSPSASTRSASTRPTPTRSASDSVSPVPEQSEPADDPAGDPAAEQLARLVASRWQREEEQRQVQDPFPLPVRWRTAPDALTDHWSNILRLPPKATAHPLDLNGRLDEITGMYRRIPSGRLVVLGRSGSGKTILALRFVLDHLATRKPTEPVPVIFSIGAWNPTTITLRDWLTAQLTRDHPGYAARVPGGESQASQLVESGRILPVLDGFDEIAAGLRRPALEAINATTLPLVLTSRPAEYADAVAETDVLTSAAAIELTDLTLDDLADYLPRTTRKAGRADPAANAWDPVLTALRERSPRGPASPLAAVLATPLMVALARTIYSDTPEHDPASLLDTERFTSPEELEDHLLDNFIPTVYRRRLPRPRGTAPHPGIAPERARRWLGHLAHHLSRLETPDLAWWRLGGSLRRSTRTLVTILVTGLVIGVVDCAVGVAFTGTLAGSLVDATAVGLLAGVMFGLAHWLTFTVKGLPVTPSAVRLRIRGRPASLQWSAGPRLVIGTLGGAFFGFTYGGVVGLVRSYVWHTSVSTALHIALIDGILFGLVFGGGAGITFCLLGLLETPLDISSAVNPRSLLTANRRTVTTQLLVWAPAFGTVVGVGAGTAVDHLQGLLGPLTWNTTSGLVLGIISGLGGALGYTLTLTAWGQWAVLTRIWLPLTGRLPWAVMAFLEDAYQRGVLRQAGAVYQFRHARLQHHLAGMHRTRVSRLFHRSSLASGKRVGPKA
ncbi:helix-turn-helix domain-containing protein [Streptomyces sp. NPDC020800]|uniref:helix-turn-helix domain-containing protein n=1 Tax=Streptomyces sp. NPDC020800 TaxID=3365092 RepID=UPI0037B5391E